MESPRQQFLLDTRYVTGDSPMIRSFRHKGLKRLYEKDMTLGVPPPMLAKIRVILVDLDVAKHPMDLDKPDYQVHALKGDLRGFWSVRVSGNYRVIFRLVREPEDVDLIDYH